MTKQTGQDWTQQTIAEGQGETVYSPMPPQPPSASVGSMFSDARAKAKGQGVVKGSTIFFKNLAESVAHSNRNLKIGVAVLTATFVVVAVGLGFLVFKLFKDTSKSGAEAGKTFNALRANVQDVLTRTEKIEADLFAMDTRLQKEMATVKASSDQSVEALRAEITNARNDAQAAAAEARAAKEWMEKSIPVITENFRKLDERLRALEGGKPKGSEPVREKNPDRQ